MPWSSAPTTPRPLGGLTPATVQQATGARAEAQTSGAGGAGNGFASDAANLFRRLIPQGVRDVAGQTVQTALSGERAANVLLPGDPGTAAMNAIRRVPKVGGALAAVADTVTSPLTLGTIGFGGWLGAAAKAGKLGLAGRAAAPLLAPVVEGGLGARALGEVGLAAGQQGAMAIADKAGADPTVTALAGIAGGLGGARALRGITGGTPNLIAEANAAQAEAARLTRVDKAADVLKANNFMPDGLPSLSHQLSTFNNYTPGQRELATKGFQKMLRGDAPLKSETDQLARALGPGLHEAAALMQEAAPAGKPSIFEQAMDALGVPRSLMASFDASHPFRQSIVLTGRKGFWRSMEPMVRAMAKPDYARGAEEAMMADPFLAKAFKPVEEGGYGLRHDNFGDAEAVKKAEGFASKLAGRIPGVKMSERGFVTFGNKVRGNVLQDIVKGWDAAGKNYTDETVTQMADWLNMATGRASSLTAKQGLVNMDRLMFAPQLWVSRGELLTGKTWLHGTVDPLVRTQARADVARFFGAGMTALTLVKLTGELAGEKATVELDPRSSDFGKVRVGDTRMDPWGGFQPIARYLAQLVTGEMKTSTGNIRQKSRGETVGGFVRSKLAPVPSWLVDAFTGTNFIGQEVDVTQGGQLSRSMAERAIPLFIQDMQQALSQGGLGAGLMTLPAALGVGVQTYKSTSSVRESGAQEMFSKPWAQLNGEQQAQVEDAHAEDLAKQAPPAAGSLGDFIDSEKQNLHAFEQDANKWRQQGGDARTFTENMLDRNQTRIDRINGRMSAEQRSTGGADLLDRYFALREDATGPAGVVDYEKLDQLQANFLQELTPADRLIVEKRRSFEHAPEVQWWVDARKKITDSGYWKTQGTAVDKSQALISAIAPGAATYNQLAFMANDPNADASTKRRIAAVIKRIDDSTTRDRTAMRRKDPALDKALVDVYGLKPIAGRLH